MVRPLGRRSRLRRTRRRHLPSGGRCERLRALAQRGVARRRGACQPGHRDRRPARTAPGRVLRSRRRAVGRRLDAAVAAEVERLAEMAITDPLTVLRNDPPRSSTRTSQQAPARGAHRGPAGAGPARPRRPEGDQRQATATRPGTSGCRPWPTRSGPRAEARTSRIAWAATSSPSSFRTPAAGARWSSPSACAGRRRPAPTGPGPSPRPPASPRRSTLRSEGRGRCARPTSPSSAPSASTRTSSSTAPTSPRASTRRQEDEHHTRTLASALARAVDAKDSYTRSHCQTVSQLCGLIGAELGLRQPGGSRAIRQAALLHDVGKIGVPDASSPSGPAHPEECDLIQRTPCSAATSRWPPTCELRPLGAPPPRALRRRRLPARPRRRRDPLEARIILVADPSMR